ncbi:helix-turn-helix domain-containing protein [uncultured Streptococcus sp.]|uniref:helix-turn-helix domain-containing protein n=1 Tax=uncultured Streptococcus sp. TaxID=83427 RepID=UPI00265F55BF|nr:helix-turn-helix domain-containing protein [uncultured Streptococcus sp.]
MNRLKELRKQKKVTQLELANFIGMTRRGYQKWENGESQIKPEKAQLLADYFGVEVPYLLGYDVGLTPVKDLTGDYLPPLELQGYDYTVLDIEQDTSEKLNEVSKVKYCIVKLHKGDELPLFTGFRAIISDYDREIVIESSSKGTLLNAFRATDALSANGYKGVGSQFKHFGDYINSRKNEDSKILENILTDWLDIVGINKKYVNISYFNANSPTPNKVITRK